MLHLSESWSVRCHPRTVRAGGNDRKARYMTRGSVLSVSLTVVTMATMLTAIGCRQAQTRSGSPTPLPGYQSAPAGSDARMIAPPPPDAVQIPGVPPSTAQTPKLEGPFGFTPPKLAGLEPLPALRLPPLPEESDAAQIQPTSSDEEPIALPEPEVAGPVLVPLPSPDQKSEAAAVELDPSLFLIDLFEDAALEAPTPSSPPTTVNGLTIQPGNAGWQAASSREPPAWPADGLVSPLSISPGPVVPKWTSDPFSTRPPNSRPRRLMIENSDSAMRPIE
jgi:hypothetical protein